MALDYIMELFSEAVKLLALMTPPAVLSAFLSASHAFDLEKKRAIARKTSLAVFIIGFSLYFLGEQIFSIFGFTLDAFRIGSGTLLFLSAVSMINEKPSQQAFCADDDISVVPLAIPLCMGPASIGTLMVLGASSTDLAQRVIGALALLIASLCIYIMLYFSTAIARVLGRTGMAVLAKLTGLLLAGIAAQVIFTGVRSFLRADSF